MDLAPYFNKVHSNNIFIKTIYKFIILVDELSLLWLFERISELKYRYTFRI